MKITRNQVLRLNDLLEVLKGIKNFKFQYANLKNKKILDAEVEIIKEMAKTEPFTKMKQYEDFEAVRMELLNLYTTKEEDGRMKVIKDEKGSHYDIPDEKMVEFNELYAKLEADNKEMLGELVAYQEANKKVLEELLVEEIEVDLYKLKTEFFPADLDREESEMLLLIAE